MLSQCIVELQYTCALIIYHLVAASSLWGWGSGNIRGSQLSSREERRESTPEEKIKLQNRDLEDQALLEKSALNSKSQNHVALALAYQDRRGVSKGVFRDFNPIPCPFHSNRIHSENDHICRFFSLLTGKSAQTAQEFEAGTSLLHCKIVTV